MSPSATVVPPILCSLCHPQVIVNTQCITTTVCCLRKVCVGEVYVWCDQVTVLTLLKVLVPQSVSCSNNQCDICVVHSKLSLPVPGVLAKFMCRALTSVVKFKTKVYQTSVNHRPFKYSKYSGPIKT